MHGLKRGGPGAGQWLPILELKVGAEIGSGGSAILGCVPPRRHRPGGEALITGLGDSNLGQEETRVRPWVRQATGNWMVTRRVVMRRVQDGYSSFSGPAWV